MFLRSLACTAAKSTLVFVCALAIETKNKKAKKNTGATLSVFFIVSPYSIAPLRSVSVCSILVADWLESLMSLDSSVTVPVSIVPSDVSVEGVSACVSPLSPEVSVDD